jgi:hypothetical protein
LVCTTGRANPFPPCRGTGIAAFVGLSVSNRKRSTNGPPHSGQRPDQV